MNTRLCTGVILLCTFTALLLAQAPAAPPKPGPEHKKLEYFVGKWTVQGDAKANPFGPAGKINGVETYTMGPGGFYLERRFEGKIPAGDLKHLGIMGFDSQAKTYTYYGASSDGGVGTASGSLKGNVWTWATEDKFSGKAIKGRFTAIASAPGEYTYKYETANANGTFTLVEEGKSTKAGR